MNKKYKQWAILIAVVLVICLFVGLGYYIFVVENKDDVYSVTQGCVEIIYSSGEDKIKMKSLALSDSDGKSVTPYSLTFTNKCKHDVEFELRLNLENNENIDKETVKIFVNGDISIEPNFYTLLDNSDISNEEINSKVLSIISLEPNSSIRTNVRMWIDDKTGSKVSPNNTIEGYISISESLSEIEETFKETIIAHNGGKDYIESKAAINSAILSTQNEGLNKVESEMGTSYYFRGNVDNNYVSFAGHTWRIVRINENDTIKLIYESDNYDKSLFNEDRTSEDAVGFTFQGSEAAVDSKIKLYLDEWYKNNLSSYDEYIATTKFCNDTTISEDGTDILYSAYTRLNVERDPSLDCKNSIATYGGLYEIKIGLITADEVNLAGGLSATPNNSYYLYSNEGFYTMTPSDYTSSTSNMMIVSRTGELTSVAVNQSLSVRPVINIKSNVFVNGSGTLADPYTINLDTK